MLVQYQPRPHTRPYLLSSCLPRPQLKLTIAMWSSLTLHGLLVRVDEVGRVHVVVRLQPRPIVKAEQRDARILVPCFDGLHLCLRNVRALIVAANLLVRSDVEFVERFSRESVEGLGGGGGLCVCRISRWGYVVY